MAVSTLRYRWTLDDFLRAEQAEVFTGRVELVDGEVWPLPIGRWHGRTTLRCVQLLGAEGVVVTTESLVTGDSLPDPDVWVCPAGAQELGWLSPRISRWAPSDALLVVEVSDEEVAEDLSIKARLYGAAGYAVYWVVTRDTVHEHTGPVDDGYRTVVRHQRGDEISLPYADRSIAVDALLGAPSD